MILRHNRMNVDNDDDIDFEESPVTISYLDDDSDNDIEEEGIAKINIDDDSIIDSLNETHVNNKSKVVAHSTTMKKKKVEKVFISGDNVIYKKKNAMVVFGPYEKNYKQIYELQMEDGTIVSAIVGSIKSAKKK